MNWLQSFDIPAEIIVAESRQMVDILVLNVHTDQSGIVGLVRRLHGLGITILQVQFQRQAKPLKSKKDAEDRRLQEPGIY